MDRLTWSEDGLRTALELWVASGFQRRGQAQCGCDLAYPRLSAERSIALHAAANRLDLRLEHRVGFAGSDPVSGFR